MIHATPQDSVPASNACHPPFNVNFLLETSSSFSEFHFCHQCQLPPASLLNSTPSISPNRLSIALNSSSVLKKHETTPQDQKRAMLVTPLWGYFPARNYLAFPACPDQHVKTRFNMQRLSPPCWLTSCMRLPPISLISLDYGVSVGVPNVEWLIVSWIGQTLTPGNSFLSAVSWMQQWNNSGHLTHNVANDWSFLL